MKLPFKRSKISLCVGLVLTTGYQANAAEDEIEEILVSSALPETVADTVHPVTVLSGDELRQKVGNTLGATLANEPGININSYGTGVGQPIIRGQTGNRVSVLQNSVGVSDVSAQSPDHANAVEPILADRIEVLRGPSTLLYGSGAIGGIVNVIDNRIPSELVEETNFIVQQSHNTVNNEDKTVVRLDTSVGDFGLHFDGFKRKNDNVDIDGWAIDEMALEQLEEHMHEAIEALHDDDHDDHDDHDEEDPNTYGYIGNSDAESSGATGGFSYVTDRGFIGFSVSQ
ncbi:MAG: TonB-dependent receptor plug domain-containing protein, partial [Pseudohongiellaceae bacterium]